MTEHPATHSILVIDDEDSICLAFRRFFERRGWSVQVASSGARGLAAFQADRPDVVFLDVRLPDGDGLTFLGQLHATDAGVPVIVITAYGGLDTVVRAVGGEAFEYLPKPIDLDAAERLALRALAASERAGAPSAEGPAADEGEPHLVGASHAMQTVYKRIAVLARSDCSVLLLGQTGTGKEVVARAIHHHSARGAAPFVAVNCGALPDSLVEGELFGHVRGAFTGAEADRMGRFETAHGGTLFLDEVGDLPEPAQVALLRALDSQTVERIGSDTARRLDVRVIAAANRDLPADVEAGRFRADLYYRLAVVQITLPPLTERAEDILPLARHFLAAAAGSTAPAIDDDAEEALLAYPWPGNVRELKNAIEHAWAVAPDARVTLDDLPATFRAGGAGQPADAAGDLVERYIANLADAPADLHRRAIEPIEAAVIRHALRRCNGNQSRAADLLGLHRNTLRHKVRDFGINPDTA